MRRLQSNCEQRSRLGTHNSKLTTHLHSRLDSSRSKSKTPTELSTHRQKPHLFPASTVMEAQALHGLSTHQEGFTFLAQLSGPSFYCVRPHNSPGDCTSHTEQKATATYPCKGPRSAKMLATCSCLLAPAQQRKEWTRVPFPPAVSKSRKEVTPANHRDTSSYLEVRSRRKASAGGGWTRPCPSFPPREGSRELRIPH